MLPNVPQLARLTAALGFVLLASPLTAHGQDYVNLSATDAARLIREGKLSSRDLVTALLKQIDA